MIIIFSSVRLVVIVLPC